MPWLADVLRGTAEIPLVHSLGTLSFMARWKIRLNYSRAGGISIFSFEFRQSGGKKTSLTTCRILGSTGSLVSRAQGPAWTSLSLGPFPHTRSVEKIICFTTTLPRSG